MYHEVSILALDGGGIKGAFSAAVLAALEHATKLRCAHHFDLIAGTSTGAIIALGLGMTSQDIVSFYEEHRPALFPSSSLVQRTAWAAGDYSSDDARLEKIHQLMNHGHCEVVKRTNLEIVRARFLNAIKVSPFQPCRQE